MMDSGERTKLSVVTPAFNESGNITALWKAMWNEDSLKDSALEVVIVDVSDKNTPIQISTIDYSNIGYTHQGWFTENMEYFLLGDELDEINFGVNSRTIVFDFTDLDNPIFHMSYEGPTEAIDHNGYVVGNTFFIANYSAGMRAIDISGIASGVMVESGFIDTFTEHNATTFNGAWNIYPFFESGNIVISDIEGGLFIAKANN